MKSWFDIGKMLEGDCSARQLYKIQKTTMGRIDSLQKELDIGLTDAESCKELSLYIEALRSYVAVITKVWERSHSHKE